MSNKIIFLDIDGVMNSNVFYQERHKKNRFKLKTIKYKISSFLMNTLNIKPKGVSFENYVTPEKYHTFEYQFNRLKSETCQKKWSWLTEFCNDNDIKICISSVWKNHFGNKKSEPELWDKALTLLGFKPGTFVGITPNIGGLRGGEIDKWLQDNNEFVNDYVILDDDSDMLSEQMKHFHHCDNFYGLTPNHLYRIGRYFSGKSSYEHLSEILKETNETDELDSKKYSINDFMNVLHKVEIQDSKNYSKLWEKIENNLLK